jgi:hypothetical protein
MKGKGLLVLCCVLALAACAVPLGEDYVIIRDGGDGIPYISGYELQTYVPIPKAGNQPITLVNQGDLELSVIWKDEAGTVIPLPFDVFQPDTVYRAEIRITAKSGYAFYPSTSFAYPGGKIQAQSDDLGNPTRIIKIIYNNTDKAEFTYITDYDLQNYVPIPLAGDEPRVINREEVTVTAAWTENGSPFSGNFAAGTVYQAAIQLEAKAGYLFRERFDYPAGAGTGQTGQDDNEAGRAFTVTYDRARNPKVVNSLNLTPYIPKPAGGVMPLSSFAGPQYTGTIIWKTTGTSEALTGPFQADTEYTAEVTLSPAIGYTFTGAGQFTHGGALSVTNGPELVRISFAAAAAEGSMVVYDTDLTGRISRPIEGLTPVGSIVAPQYAGIVTWTPAHRTFQADVVYTAELGLQAAEGYTFTGIGQNAFTHGAAQGTVTNPAGSGTVRITFQPAAASVNTTGSFGHVGREDSALWLLHEKRDYIYSLAITLPSGSEEIFTASNDPGVTLVAGDTSPADIIINGQGRTLTVTTAGALLTVGGGVTLTLQNITFVGRNNTAPLFKVWPGGKLILGDGVTLRDNTTTADTGGVWVNGGELVMNRGATITGMAANRGGGVLIDANGKFSMNGGTIAGNTVSGEEEAGGGVLVATGLFTMFDGNIQSNEAAAAKSGGGVGVLSGGTFNHSGGEISGNTAHGTNSGGGVYVYEGKLTMNDADPVIQTNEALLGSSGGGVYIEGGSFVLNQGTITGNTAWGARSGGGVFVQKNTHLPDGSSVINGGEIISNEAHGEHSGGGVYVGPLGDFVSSIANIGHNSVYGAYSGGGVYVYGDVQAEKGEFRNNMSSNTVLSVIEENFAEGDYSGGGVCVTGYGVFVNQGIIRNNEAAGNYSGGGAYTSGNFSSYWGDALIAGNHASYTGADAEIGGAVYVDGGRFENGGSIKTNTTDTLNGANGVYIANGTFGTYGKIMGNFKLGTNNKGVYVKNTAIGAFWLYVSAGVIVAPENTVFLCDGAVITLAVTSVNFTATVANIRCESLVPYDGTNPDQATKLLICSTPGHPYEDYLDNNKGYFNYNNNPCVIEVVSGPGAYAGYDVGYYKGP